MDYVAHFGREVAAFEIAARAAVGVQPAPAVPSCPGWRVTDLVLHLGTVHRLLARVIGDRLQEPPPTGDLAWLEVPGECAGWLPPAGAPAGAALPGALVDWFAAGAATLRALFLAVGPDEAVWSWSADHTVGFWQRMQAIEAAVHRWDAQAAAGSAGPVDAALAVDAVSQTFEVMVPGAAPGPRLRPATVSGSVSAAPTVPDIGQYASTAPVWSRTTGRATWNCPAPRPT